MSFARIWTAALAGITLALPLALCVAAVGSMFQVVPSFGRDGLSPTFLVLWAIGTLVCVIPRHQLGQWLAAAWTSAAALVLTSLLYGFIGAAIPLLATAVTAALLMLLALALRPRR